MSSGLRNVPSAPVVAAGLVGGYLVASTTGVRPLGGLVLGACGVYAGVLWWRNRGPATTAALSALYLGGFVASHPLAKQIGAWPSVLSITAVAAGASYLLADRIRTGTPDAVRG